MLTQYLTQTAQLLQNPAATSVLYSTSDLTSYINRARGQIAGETECIRAYGTLALSYGMGTAPFSSIATGLTGVSGVFNVRGAAVSVASGQRWLHPRPFPYFQTYFLNNPVPNVDTPTAYSQFGQGTSGSLYFNPVPDYPYTINLDCVCLPSPLVDDTSPEAIPFPYTDAVPYYAAYLAFMSAQRASDAERLWQQYQMFASRARQMSNGQVNPQQYPRSVNPVRVGQIGAQAQGGN